MRVWKAIDDEKPSKSGVYRVKQDSGCFTFKYAYYDSLYDIWNYDGDWRPMIVNNYVTHWAELTKKQQERFKVHDEE